MCARLWGFGALGRERTGAGEGFSEAGRLAWGMGGGLEGGREERTVGQENGSVTSNKSLAFYRSLQYLQSRDGGTFHTEQLQDQLSDRVSAEVLTHWALYCIM